MALPTSLLASNVAPVLLDVIPPRIQTAAVRALFALPRPVRRLIAGRPIRVDGQELDLDAQLLLTLNRLANGDGLAHRDPDRSRVEMRRSSRLIAGETIEPVAVRTLDLDGIPARLYTPEGVGERAPLLVFYHGGGWVLGDLDTHDNPCRFIARGAAIKVLSVDYRLAPEHPFPAAVDDALSAYLWASKNADSLGVDPTRIAVGGDSAGGNLAAVTAHQAVRTGAPTPAFQLLFYPGTDATVRRRSRDLFATDYFLTDHDIDWFLNHYASKREHRADPRFSILRAQDLTNLPPTYIATAGFDPLRDEGEAYATALRAANVPTIHTRHPNLIHGYINFLTAPTFRAALQEAVTTLKTALALTPTQHPSSPHP
ncbi:alpha/beta hydrolase [Actinokineospora globicatena]|uniref:Alpha/beta hydrolase n=1 Tax=Actinokineospora globicatena TaxID=103729 RepID=A0A9W6VBN0_9PSEU|nr:alpha/beta hydrolase [Actinokineospora globicatena]GLW95477.1 alpha/beta hydrolase [Actinokineospora globicatena]